MVDNELLIKINADAENAKNAFDEIRGKTEDLEGILTSVAKGSAVAYAALTGEVLLAAHAFEQQEQSSRKLALALQNQGIYSSALEESYKATADQLQKLTGFDNDQIVAGQALLQNFVGQKEITQELTKAALELAQANGGNVTQGFEDLGRAIQGNSRALKGYGITIEEGLTANQRFDRVLSLVTQKLGGQAEAANQGLGSFRRLKSAFSDVQEELGKRFAPALEKGISLVTNFLESIAKNQSLLDLAAGVIGAGVAITVIIATLTAAIPVILAASAAATALSVSIGLVLAPVALAAAAIVGLGAAIGVYIAHSNRAGAQTEELDAKIVQATKNVEIYKKKMNDPIANFFNPNIAKDLEKAEADLKRLQVERQKLNDLEKEKTKPGAEQDPAKKALADKEAALLRQKHRDEEEAQKAHLEALKLQNEHASEELIKLKNEESATLKQIAESGNAQERELLREHYAQLQELEDEQRAADLEKKQAFQEEDAAAAAELRQNEVDEKAALREQDRAELQSQALSDLEIQRKIAKDILTERIKNRNLELEDRKRYGVAIATINAALRSDEINAAKTISGELVALANSKNAELKAIGKAAAIAQITISAAESAVTIASKVIEVLPFPINIPIATALAAARLAYGAEQIGKVNAAQTGGIVTGGVPGKDSVPFLLEPGELVVPKKNFDEVVTAVAQDRGATGLGESGSGNVTHQYVFNGDFMADTSFMDMFIQKFNERLEFGNARILAQGVR